MEVRDAVEADAEAMAAIADAPLDVMRNLVHDRTVRVAEADAPINDPHADVDPDRAGHDGTTVDDDGNAGGTEDAGEPRPVDEGGTILGFVSYDATDGTVHVTQLDGREDTCERLLAEPIRFATREGMDVELLVPASDETVRSAALSVGFEEGSAGPRFEGEQTTRFRYEI